MAYSQTIPFYIGTYTKAGISEGVYRCTIDTVSGELGECVLAAKIGNPSFLTFSIDGRFAYAVSEAGGNGEVAAFKVDGASGALELINRKPSGGSSACHVVLDKTGRYLFAANYRSAAVSVTPVNADGSLGEMSSLVRHEGETVADGKTKKPHAHSVNISSDNRFVFVADLGLDKIMIYRLDVEKGVITANTPAFVKLTDGAGPRHTAFSPDEKYLYSINELNSTISVLAFDGESGALTHKQTISTLPADFTGWNACAEVRISSSGKFLYGSNRGHNSIAVFSINPGDGTLSFIEHQASGIDTPRNFNIDPTGKWCLVANQKSDTVIVFEINPQTGKFKPTTNKIKGLIRIMNRSHYGY